MSTSTGAPTINRWWREYAEQSIPANAPPIQTSESRRAFYAGAAAMLDAIITGLSDGDEATDADMAHMDRLHQELMQFGRDVTEGKA